MCVLPLRYNYTVSTAKQRKAASVLSEAVVQLGEEHVFNIACELGWNVNVSEGDHRRLQLDGLSDLCLYALAAALAAVAETEGERVRNEDYQRSRDRVRKGRISRPANVHRQR